MDMYQVRLEKSLGFLARQFHLGINGLGHGLFLVRDDTIWTAYPAKPPENSR